MSNYSDQVVFKGKIWMGRAGDNYEALLIGYNSTPFAERWKDKFGYSSKQVTVRYWISESELTKDQLKENTLLAISGAANAKYGDRYSELTGYLWTDEELKVGGHDLIYELQSNVDKYLYMEVDY